MTGLLTHSFIEPGTGYQCRCGATFAVTGAPMGVFIRFFTGRESPLWVEFKVRDGRLVEPGAVMCRACHLRTVGATHHG